MKKRSCIISEESGFYLPYVLFIVALVFIIITANIRIYHHEIEITDHHIERVKAETIIQMGLAKFKEDELPTELETLHIDYLFPDGEITLIYSLISDLEYRIHCTVLTNNGLEYTSLFTEKTTAKAIES